MYTPGPSAKGKSQEEWKKLGTLIGSVNVLKRISEGKQKEKDLIKGAEAAEVTIKFYLENETLRVEGSLTINFHLCVLFTLFQYCAT